MIKTDRRDAFVIASALRFGNVPAGCQIASNRDPLFASNSDLSVVRTFETDQAYLEERLQWLC